MTSGVEPAFIDSNILVYAAVPTAPLHRRAHSTLEGLNRSGAVLWVSRQVLREYLAVLSRPQTFSQPIDAVTLASDIGHFESRLRVAEDSAAVTRLLLQLLQQVPIGGKQVHDANIVATMYVHGIRRLLTANTTDFMRYDHLITVLPLSP